MPNAIVRNTVLISGLVVGATVCGILALAVTSPRGAPGPSVLQADSVVLAVVALLAALAVATGIGCVVGKVNNTAVGMFALGGALYGLAWRMGTVLELALSGSVVVMAIETLLMAALVGGATWVVFQVSGPFRDVYPDAEGNRPNWLTSSAAMRSAAAAVLMAGVVWLIAQTPAKGQALGAVFVGGMAVGLAGRLLSPHVQPILMFPAAIVVGGLAQLVTGMMADAPLQTSIVAGKLPHFAVPMPVDYAAATCMGVAVGLGWAKSFLHHDEEEGAKAGAAT